jgi:hypothetical protein
MSPLPCHSEERSDEESVVENFHKTATADPSGFAVRMTTIRCHSEERSDEESAFAIY